MVMIVAIVSAVAGVGVVVVIGYIVDGVSINVDIVAGVAAIMTVVVVSIVDNVGVAVVFVVVIVVCSIRSVVRSCGVIVLRCIALVLLFSLRMMRCMLFICTTVVFMILSLLACMLMPVLLPVLLV